MKGFELTQAIQKPPRFKVDKSATIAFDTPELSVNEKMLLLENEGQIGSLVFVPEDSKELPPKIDKELEAKSYSVRLRNVMFVYWKHIGEPDDNFNVWRAKKMEGIIQAFKDKLD